MTTGKEPRKQLTTDIVQVKAVKSSSETLVFIPPTSSKVMQVAQGIAHMEDEVWIALHKAMGVFPFRLLE